MGNDININEDIEEALNSCIVRVSHITAYYGDFSVMSIP